MLLNYGNDILPEQWSNLNQNQIDALGRMLANGSEFVDWRSWLLSASMPWPYPTQTQLLELLYAYKKVDRKQDGYISKHAFLQVNNYLLQIYISIITNHTFTSLRLLFGFELKNQQHLRT